MHVLSTPRSQGMDSRCNACYTYRSNLQKSRSNYWGANGPPNIMKSLTETPTNDSWVTYGLINGWTDGWSQCKSWLECKVESYLFVWLSWLVFCRVWLSYLFVWLSWLVFCHVWLSYLFVWLSWLVFCHVWLSYLFVWLSWLVFCLAWLSYLFVWLSAFVKKLLLIF